MTMVAITPKEFSLFRKLLLDRAGIQLSESKKPLVSGRLAKRLHLLGVSSFDAYFRHIMAHRDEMQVAIDLLTTNETHFFREPKHFDFLREQVLPARRRGATFRIWSAASSSGEEAYSLAMLLDDVMGSEAWEVFGSDISTRVLDVARTGLYSMERAPEIPRPYLSRYCLKGTGKQEGTLLVSRDLRKRVNFRQINLNENLPSLVEFDVIFLRNVMIYFNQNTKQQVVKRICSRLRSGGYLIIGHSESLNGLAENLTMLMPSVYRKT